MPASSLFCLYQVTWTFSTQCHKKLNRPSKKKTDCLWQWLTLVIIQNWRKPKRSGSYSVENRQRAVCTRVRCELTHGSFTPRHGQCCFLTPATRTNERTVGEIVLKRLYNLFAFDVELICDDRWDDGWLQTCKRVNC